MFHIFFCYGIFSFFLLGTGNVDPSTCGTHSKPTPFPLGANCGQFGSPRVPTLSGGHFPRLCANSRDMYDVPGASKNAQDMKKFAEGANRLRARTGATKSDDQRGRLLQSVPTPNRE